MTNNNKSKASWVENHEQKQQQQQQQLVDKN